jgi:hypothetical protein
MRQEIDAVRTTTRSAAESVRQLPAIRAELDQQRRFRTEQLEELAVDAAESVAAADQNRSTSLASSHWPQNRHCPRSTPRCSGLWTARTESASAAPSRSHGSG